MSNPCHIELILTEAAEAVKKAEEVGQRLNSRQQGRATRRAITAA
jgi:large subunit ribosomal protein L17e